MPKKIKPAIFVFCEGESEMEYASFLKDRFRDVAAIQKPVKGTFNKAKANFSNSPKYRDYASETDEIWFFFDIDEEQGDKEKWNDRLTIIKQLRKLRKNPNIKVRLLMTTACIEYWFFLHFQKVQPPIKTSTDKEKMLRELETKAPTYVKGDKTTIYQIAEKYKIAIQNGEWTIAQLKAESLPRDTTEDGVNAWLYKNSKTFSNVHEAIIFLEELRAE